MFLWNKNVTATSYFLEIYKPCLFISKREAKLFNVSSVCLIKELSIESLETLFPHFHHKKVSVEGVFSLFGGVMGDGGQHGVDSDQLLVVRTVQEHRLTVLFLSLRKRSFRFR